MNGSDAEGPVSRGRGRRREESIEPDVEKPATIPSSPADDDEGATTDRDPDELDGGGLIDEENNDGHRPTMREIRSHSRSKSLSRAALPGSILGSVVGGGGGEGGGRGRGIGTAVDRSVSRPESILSRIRSRPRPGFTHPLMAWPTSPDHVVDFDGPDDPYHPLNWATWKKVVTTGLYGLITMSATWASSAYAAGTEQVADEFGVGRQVATLGTSLFLLGFGVGPLLWAPLSEVYGRRPAVMLPMLVSVFFSFGSATAKDLQTLMITRFFAGYFSSAPVSNTGGVLGDLFTASTRAVALMGYALAVVTGPVIGPIVSAAVVQQDDLGWRWTEYLTGMLQAAVLVVGVIFIDESYPPVLLVYKARRLRFESGNWALHARFEEWDVSVAEMAKKFLVRPVQLLTTPICFLVALYASFCYGILYMQLGGIPIIFAEHRGWNPFVASLVFLNILIGVFLGCGVNFLNQKHYTKAYRAAGNRPVPERRLPPMMVGAVLFSAGQFVTGWTADAEYHWIIPCIGFVLFGTGFFTLFQAALNYLVDTFQANAASAVAANTFLRSVFAAALPLVVGPMYHNIGIGPGMSIMGGFATLLIPVPYVFFIYGKRIRARYKWSKASVYDEK
ncbi:Major Facilitator Superfamily [Geosmithia morbida]|uniref:Major Facilitator Superfamily n=1 Tax=Geosmithia morbida TaxID=1094350 RepID=A0A9P4YTU2_9HYPO|nr:Major Facilitator Superfamily [Geosmithia morbida]KAF4122993.1 Major Facilitator Superfamily [Geosmithia morbida]